MLGMKNSIIWFRNDLRLHDNEALYKAVQNSESIIPVYCIDTDQFKIIEPNLPKTGWFRANFLLESLKDLDTNLRHLGSGLIVGVGKPEEVLSSISKKYNAKSIYASKEITSEEVEVENKVEKKINSLGGKLNLFWQSTLYHLEDLSFPINSLPDVFTQFRKKVEKYSTIRDSFPTPVAIHSPIIPKLDLPGLKSLGLSKPKISQKSTTHFKGGEANALQRLKHYFWDSKSLSKYKETRNGLLGLDYSSKFSPWLANGCISPRFIYNEVLKYEEEVIQNDSTYWLIFELIWRDYFRFVAYRYKHKIFRYSGIKDINLPLKKDLNLFSKWVSGTTGYPFIDANMIELKQTGFMSNRGRQNVASFLVKDLKVNWKWRASYFESQLIDYDPCSNWGNWNYIAGIGNDPREDRYFNTLSQAKKYDYNGEYIKYWISCLKNLPSNFIHNPSSMSSNQQKEFNLQLNEDYPEAIVNLQIPSPKKVR